MCRDVDAVKAANAYNTRLDSAAYNSSQDYVDECEYIEYSGESLGVVLLGSRKDEDVYCVFLALPEQLCQTKLVESFGQS